MAAFLVLSCLTAAVLAGGILWVNKQKSPKRRPISLLFAAAFVTVVCNALAVNVHTEWAASFFYVLYYIAGDWILVLILFLTGVSLKKNRSRTTFLWCSFLCLIDTVFLLSNLKFHQVFHCVESVLPNGRVRYGVQFEITHYAFVLHILLRCVLLFIILLTYIRQMFATIALYRGRYLRIVWSVLAIIVISSLGRIFALPMDITSILYAVLAILCVYFSYFYISRGIVAKVLSLLIEDTQQGIVCFDKDGRCIQLNSAYASLFGERGTKEYFEQYFEEWRRQRGELREEFWREAHEVDGEMHYYDVHFNILQDDKGSFVGSFFSFTDRTESVMEYEQKRYEASHDELTDIYNRKRFFQEVEVKLKEEPEVQRVMVCIDVKDFSVVNSLFGEKTGNQILQRIAGLMRRDASENTIYGRLESDHFAMCMREEDFVEADYAEYLEDLKRIVHSSVYRMHAHVGVYRIIDSSINISVMCDRAFAAIESIKDSYQHIVAYYTEDMGKTEQREKVMIGEFDRALAAGEFQMFLQPQISVGDYRVLGAEALVRWEHPVRGMISPGSFIPVFERSGQITRLDNFMWEMACKQLRVWKDQGIEDLHISVNISPRDFYLVDIYNTFTSLVEQYGINPWNLKLEITETALMEEISKQFSLLEKLRKYGFQVEIDDFGSGYSSLNTLQDIEVDVLKLDMGFLRKTTHGKRSKTIMNAVIEMSKNLGLTVVTEGVETQEQVDYLTWAGCDIFQGYYFSKPIPVKQFEAKYLTNRYAGSV